ncbi:MAG: alanine--glyoxylate aminotransferase family protein [Magnetococcales bacterium]|nr:alanine--glyoxylate aminotransferase family protein [Magnetococcales bacterium]
MNPALLHQHVYTPGPVRMAPDILQLGSLQTPYFRNAAFSELVLECEAWLLELAHAPVGSRVVFLTAAGTAAMEAAVMNLLSPERAVGVVNGGTFGQRFVDICQLHRVPVQPVVVDRDPLTDGRALAGLDRVEALLLNAHETSVGHLYDLNATGRYCQHNDCLHVVDGISMFVTDPVDMQAQRIDALMVSSHKGLALPPGLAMVLLAPRALERIHPSGSCYLDFATYLKDGERGQTPFTPAVSIFLQLHERLRQLKAVGLPAVWARTRAVAEHFRRGVASLPLTPYATHMPNAMTALEVTDGRSAVRVVQELETQHHCVVAPNGGTLRERVFRVAHMGATDINDMDRLLAALHAVMGV